MAETGVLLEAKIHRPGQIRNMVERRELERRLEEAGERLILLQATMGYGKTVFVNAYGQRGTRAQAWYHLSSLDNDLVTFAEYLAASVRVCCPAFRFELRAGKFWKEPRAFAQQLAQDFAAALLELSGQRKDAFLLDLVLDDFQEIHSEEIFLFLDGLLHHLPDGMRIILTQKSAVPQFAVKYMLSGDARIFDAQDLAFSRAELGELLEKLSKSPVSREAADAVYSCSEGWPAGVMFLGLFIRRRRLRLEPSEIGSVMQESRMYDFIMYELFRKLSFDIQRFLMRTSPLEYLSAGLCRAVTGEKDAAGILDYLFQEGLFIQKVEGKVLVYRYHALFRNFLLSQLKDEERREILNAAALYLLNTDQKEQAVAYAMESGSRAIVLKAVESSGTELIREGRMHLLESWLRFIQAEKTEYSPRALTVFGYYRLWQGKAEEGLSFLRKGIERAGLQREERLFLATAETAVRYLFAKRRFCEADSLLAGAVREYAYCFGSKKFPLQICLLWSALFCGREREAAELCASLPQEQKLLREIPGILETDRETASAAISKLERYEAAFCAVSETEQAAEQGNGENELLSVLAQTGAAVCPSGEQTETISRRQAAEVLQAICAYHILLRAAELEDSLSVMKARLSLICRSLAETPYAGCARLLAGARLFAGGQRREAARCIFPAIEILGNAGMGELKLPGRVFELSAILRSSAGKI